MPTEFDVTGRISTEGSEQAVREIEDVSGALTELQEAQKRAAAAAQAQARANSDAIWERRRDLLVTRSYLFVLSDSVGLMARFNKGSKEMQAVLRGVNDVMSVLNFASFAYMAYLRMKEIQEYRAAAAVKVHAAAQKELAASQMLTAATGRASMGGPGLGGISGLGGAGRMGGLIGRLGGGVGAASFAGIGLSLGLLGAEYLAPAMALALRGKDPFGSEYKTMGQIMAPPTGPAPRAVAFSQYNEFNAPVTSESVRMLDDANKRMLRQFGESP